MKRSILTALCVFTILLSAPLCFAEMKTFIKEYSYQASEFDSKASSRTVALEQVKRLLLEEIGTYLENHTEVKNFELTKDKITALTAGILQTQVLDEKWDGKNYWLKAEIKADPENVAKSIDTLRRDQQKSEDMKERINKQDEALKELEKLRKEVALLKDDLKAQEKFNKSIEILNKSSQGNMSFTDNQSTSAKVTPPSRNVAVGKRPSVSTGGETGREGRFIAYNNGTVLDTQTNLMWAAKDNTSDIDYYEAKSYCENYRGAGYSDWRMPTQNELAGLYDKSKSYRSDCLYDSHLYVHLTDLIRLTCTVPWASETRDSDAALFNFARGLREWLSQSYANGRALPVRSAK